MITIQIYIKNVYGKENIYMIESDASQSIRILTGKKTLDFHDITNLKKLGIQFEQVIPNRMEI